MDRGHAPASRSIASSSRPAAISDSAPTSRDTETTLHVQRAVALASIAFDALQSARAHLAVAFELGVASFARSTRTAQPPLSKTPADSTQSLALGLALRAGVQLVASRTLALELEIGAGFLTLPAAPVLRYAGASGRVDHALWAVQPAVQLGPRLRIAL